MAQVPKINSNFTALNWAEEAGPKVLPTAAQVWYPGEPNSYSDFGGQVETIARNPINPSRQRKKGSAVDLEASAGYETDLTQENLQRQLRGFMFANYREKPDTQSFNSEVVYASDGTVATAADPIIITNVDGTNDEYDNTGDDFTASPGGFLVGDLVLASGFTNAANNGLKRVTSVAALTLGVAEDIVDEASPPTSSRLTMVGFQFNAGDLDVDASSGFAKYTTTTKDLTELGIVPGEWIYVGGDAAALAFTNAANNGYKRVRSVSANEMVIDKSDSDMVTEASTTETVQIFLGRVIKNESSSNLIVTRTYQFERVFPGNNDTDLTREQAEYTTGCYAGELNISVSSADKVTVDLTYVALDSTTIDENITGANTLKSKLGTATKVSLAEADLFNTSSDVPRSSLTSMVDGDEAPTPLFLFLQEYSISVNNSLTANKAVGVFGSCGVTVGQFIVDANATAYFSDVAAIQAVRNTTDVSLDFHLTKENAGVSVDLPLLTLGDGRPNVAQDEAVTLPLTNAAATGAKIDPTLDHTLLFVFFDYLPTAARS